MTVDHEQLKEAEQIIREAAAGGGTSYEQLSRQIQALSLIVEALLDDLRGVPA